MVVKAKKSKKTNTRVAKKAKKNTDKKLFIALGVLLVVIVAGVGIIYYRQSQASNVAKIYPDFVFEQNCSNAKNGYCDPILRSSGRWFRTNPPSTFPNLQERFVRINSNGTVTCANVVPESMFKKYGGFAYGWSYGQKVIVTEVHDCFPRS